MTTLKELQNLKGESDLRDRVLDDLIEYAQDEGEEQLQGYIEDILQHGLQSGIVGSMIYYSDTLAFYIAHKNEINDLLTDLIDGTGLPIHELFGDKFDQNDPLALDPVNQNLLAWFGYEETARHVADELGLEV